METKEYEIITNEISNNQEGQIDFIINNKRIISLKSNGDIYVKDKLIENDKELVDALREYLFIKTKQEIRKKVILHG